MTISEALLHEFESESAKTRKILASVPFDNPGWRPHEKSMTIAHLATHIAEIPLWAERILQHDSHEYQRKEPHYAASRDELLEIFDRSTANARAAIAATQNENWLAHWVFIFGGHKALDRPRNLALREVLMNHLIHHRGQLSVYLRLRDVPVPGMYGPSADEK